MNRIQQKKPVKRAVKKQEGYLPLMHKIPAIDELKVAEPKITITFKFLPFKNSVLDLKHSFPESVTLQTVRRFVMNHLYKSADEITFYTQEGFLNKSELNFDQTVRRIAGESSEVMLYFDYRIDSRPFIRTPMIHN